MSDDPKDPFAKYKAKYGTPPKTNPFGSYNQKYGVTQPDTTTAVAPPDEAPKQGLLSKAGDFVVGAAQQIPHIAYESVAGPLSLLGGIDEETKNNPLSRSASRRFGSPGITDQTVTNEERGLPSAATRAGEMAKGIVTAPVTAPIELAKTIMDPNTTAKDVGARTVDAAAALLMAKGAIKGARGLIKGKPAAITPTEPTADAVPEVKIPIDDAKVPSAKEILDQADATEAARKSKTSMVRGLASRRAIRWKKATPEQRQVFQPGLAPDEYAKEWKDLSKDARAKVEAEWFPEPTPLKGALPKKESAAPDTNLDTSPAREGGVPAAPGEGVVKAEIPTEATPAVAGDLSGPVAPVAGGTAPPEKLTPAVVGDVGSGIVSSLYDGLFEAHKKGSTTVGGINDPVLVTAKKVGKTFASADEISQWVNSGEYAKAQATPTVDPVEAQLEAMRQRVAAGETAKSPKADLRELKVDELERISRGYGEPVQRDGVPVTANRLELIAELERRKLDFMKRLDDAHLTDEEGSQRSEIFLATKGIEHIDRVLGTVRADMFKEANGYKFQSNIEHALRYGEKLKEAANSAREWMAVNGGGSKSFVEHLRGVIDAERTKYSGLYKNAETFGNKLLKELGIKDELQKPELDPFGIPASKADIGLSPEQINFWTDQIKTRIPGLGMVERLDLAKGMAANDPAAMSKYKSMLAQTKAGVEPYDKGEAMRDQAAADNAARGVTPPEEPSPVVGKIEPKPEPTPEPAPLAGSPDATLNPGSPTPEVASEPLPPTEPPRAEGTPPSRRWAHDIPEGKPGITVEKIDGGYMVVSRGADGLPNGYLTLLKYPFKGYQPKMVEVRPDVRRTGIATKLYEAAKEAGVKKFVNDPSNIIPGEGGPELIESLKKKGIYGESSAKQGTKTVEEIKARLAEIEQLDKDGNIRGPEMRTDIEKEVRKLNREIKKAEKASEPAKSPSRAALEKARDKNDAAKDRGDITEEQWGVEDGRISDEILKLVHKEKAAVPKPKPEPKPKGEVLESKTAPADKVRVSRKGVVLDRAKFRDRMKDDLTTVTKEELEARVEDLNERMGEAAKVDKVSAQKIQDRLSQVVEELKSRGSVEERHAGFPNPLKNLFKRRKVVNDTPFDAMSPAEQAIAKSVKTEPDLTKPEGVRQRARKLAAQIVDSEYGFRRAADKILGKESAEAKHLGMLSEIGSGALTRTEEVVRGQGPMLPTADGNWVRTGTQSIHDVIQSVGGEHHVGTLGRVWASLNAIELHSLKGKNAGIDLIAARKFVGEVDPKFIKAAFELRKIAFDMARYANWGGLVSDAALADFATRKFYAPIRRIIASEGDVGRVSTTGGKGTVSPSGNPIRRMRGSSLDQVNPIETLIDNAYRTIKSSEQNYRVQRLADGAAENPGAAKGILEPASGSTRRIFKKTLEGKVDQMIADAAKDGITMTRDEAMSHVRMLGDDALNLADNLMSIWKDGKPELYRVSNELGYAIKHMNAEEFKLATAIAGWPAKIVHGGVVADPFFLARQLVLDNMQAYINSQYGFNPLKLDQLRGYLHLIRNTPLAKEYRLAGGGFSGLTSSRFRASRTALADAVRPQTSGPISEAVQQIKEIRPVQAWKTMVAPLEEAARVAEYMRARGAGASMVESIYAAKRVTTNFQRLGGEMQAAAHTVPFLNAGIQGVAQMVENFNRDPKGWTSRAAISVAVPAATLWFLNKDDKDIQELRRAEGGQKYFFMRGPDGAIVKMRKPYLEGAIFANGIEAALDAVNEQNPGAIAEWGKAMGREASFNAITTLGSVPLSLWANKDLRTGVPIVPERMEDIDPGYATGPYTGAAARVIGKGLDVSPAQVEYAVRGFTGGAGALAMKAVDAAIEYNKDGQLPRLRDIPGMGSFLAKYPTTATKSMQQFYNDSDELMKVTSTIEYLAKSQPEELDSYITSHQKEIALSEIMAGFKKDISSAQAVINQVRDMPNSVMSRSERDKTIDQLVTMMVQQAQMANETVAKVREMK